MFIQRFSFISVRAVSDSDLIGDVTEHIRRRMVREEWTQDCSSALKEARFVREAAQTAVVLDAGVASSLRSLSDVTAAGRAAERAGGTVLRSPPRSVGLNAVGGPPADVRRARGTGGHRRRRRLTPCRRRHVRYWRGCAAPNTLLQAATTLDDVAERCFDGDRLSPTDGPVDVVVVVDVACSRSGDDGSTIVAGSTADSALCGRRTTSLEVALTT